jgi:FixJ family two-component response regulator
MRDTTTVFLVDDDPSILRATARGLQTAGYHVEAFLSPALFLARPPYDGIGCLIVDFRMSEMNGLELQNAVKRTGSTLPVIFLTGHGDIPTTVRALKAGAVDFLTKPYALDQLLTTVSRAVARHREILTASEKTAEMRIRLQSLTARELEVCRLVGQGLLNKQIAGDLGTAEGTIKIHRRRVMEKLGVESVAELVRFLDRVDRP